MATSEKQIRTEVSEKSGVAASVVAAVLEALAHVFTEHMSIAGDKVPMGGIGIFTAKEKGPTAPRMGRNLKTGKEMPIPAKPGTLAIKFKVNKNLKIAIGEAYAAAQAEIAAAAAAPKGRRGKVAAAPAPAPVTPAKAPRGKAAAPAAPAPAAKPASKPTTPAPKAAPAKAAPPAKKGK